MQQPWKKSSPIPFKKRKIEQAFIEGFSQALNISFTDYSLSSNELSRVAGLVIEKYDNPIWTQRI